MHMADALVSPLVGGAMWGATAGLISSCAKKVKAIRNDRLVPMMGVLGAFIFAAQMINFSIPGTGSSGHLGGGLLLAALLGPHAAFLVISSVLTIQALFFADGGLLSLGCNIFNMGFFPAFIAYPFIYRVIVQDAQGTARLWGGSVLAAVAGLLAGAFAVVLETTASGISDLPFGTFVLLMLPIHLAIGVVEGLATAAVVTFVAHARPEILAAPALKKSSKTLKPVLAGLLIAAFLLGGVISWFASTKLDGLEWSIKKTSGSEEMEIPDEGLHSGLAAFQEKTAFLPDYGFKSATAETELPADDSVRRPIVDAGTSVAGLVGGLITLAVAGLIGYSLRSRHRNE
jgi:cobalt/nickel transport system permease protein